MNILNELNVSLAAQSYKIVIGQGLIRDISRVVPLDLKGRSLFVLTDENVVNPYGMTVYEGLKSCGARNLQMLAVPAGESSKSMPILERVLSWMLSHDADRQSVLFVVGGGVIGDLGGLAAALVMRGMHFVQVPTTLLAQVDSSVGGKTAINMEQGKNMVGAFYQPIAVVCDLDVLKTLPRREFLSGYAEIVKYGLIDDPDFFIWLEKNGADVCAGRPEALSHAIATACGKKARIVEADEREQGVRALLNLGHTFGHALEAAAGYDGRLLHGEAVAIGMVLAFQLSRRMGICPENDVARVIACLSAVGLPTRVSMILPSLRSGVDEIINFMRHDKKASGGRMIFILARGIGRSFVSTDVVVNDVEATVIQSIEGE